MSSNLDSPPELTLSPFSPISPSPLSTIVLSPFPDRDEEALPPHHIRIPTLDGLLPNKLYSRNWTTSAETVIRAWMAVNAATALPPKLDSIESDDAITAFMCRHVDKDSNTITAHIISFIDPGDWGLLAERAGLDKGLYISLFATLAASPGRPLRIQTGRERQHMRNRMYNPIHVLLLPIRFEFVPSDGFSGVLPLAIQDVLGAGDGETLVDAPLYEWIYEESGRAQERLLAEVRYMALPVEEKEGMMRDRVDLIMKKVREGPMGRSFERVPMPNLRLRRYSEGQKRETIVVKKRRHSNNDEMEKS